MASKPFSLALKKTPLELPLFKTGTAFRLCLLLVVLFAAIWVGLAPLTSVPAVVPAIASADQFSAERAMRHLEVIAAEPHPIGSARNAVVRDYLVEQIRLLGLTPEIQNATLIEVSPLWGNPGVTAVQNVLVRVPGTDSSRAILIEGHYDSVPTSPGAADCGSCTAVVLEAMRAIISGPPLKNDVIFLFTDGEEVFIAGAKAFMQQHPWAKDVELSLVFEAVGSDSASMLYTTGPESGWWVSEALRAAPHPLAFSFLNDVMWKLAGNSGSDLDALITGGRGGLAFTNVSLATAPGYHTLADGLKNLDPRTVQDHGAYAVSLLRHFGSLRLDSPPQIPNDVYFPIFPNVVVRYPGAWVLPLSYLAAFSTIIVAGLGLRRRRISFGGILSGMLVFLLDLIAVIALVTLAWWLIRKFNPNLHGWTFGGWYGAPFYLAAFAALMLAVGLALHFLWRRRIGLDALLIGGLAWWALLALLSGLGLPGFSYMFTWPLLAALVASGYSYMQPEKVKQPGRQFVIFVLPAVLGLVLLSPVIQLLFFFASRMEGMMGLPLAALPAPLAVLLLVLLLPMIELFAPIRRRWLPAGAALACLVFLLIATVQSGYDARQPKPSALTYWQDADRGQAEWITINDARAGRSLDAKMDAWTRQFFPQGGEETAFTPFLNASFSPSYPALKTSAPVVQVPGSTVHMLADETSGGARRLSLQITAEEGVLNSHVYLKTDGPIQSLAANGRPFDLQGQNPESVQVNLIGRNPQGVILDLALSGTGAVKVTVRDRTLGLPAIPGLTIAPRPAWMMPAPLNDVADSTIVERKWEW